jgi:hypothetical protein
MITIAYFFFMWKQLKPGLVRGLYWIKCGFISERFNMQMDFFEYARHLQSIEIVDEVRAERIHLGIEEFRETWKKYCDHEEVGRLCRELYAIHNMKPLNFEITVQGIIMQKKGG